MSTVKEYIVEGNKLIAQYMGYKYIPFEKGSSVKPGWWNMDTPENVFKYALGTKISSRHYLCRTHKELKYYNSWDALIPVMEKISKDHGVKEKENPTKLLFYARVAGEAMVRFDRHDVFSYVLQIIKLINSRDE